MSKERLEEIKKRTLISTSTFGDIEVIHIEYHDYDWLIEQAERAQELEEENKRYREALKLIMRRTDYELYPDLIQVNTIAWKALEDNE